MRSSLAISVAATVVAVLSLSMTLLPPVAFAHGTQVVPYHVAALEVRGELPPPPAGVTSIKFGEFFRMPVGPLGLEPSDKLMSLNGHRVRLVGYVVREDDPVPGRFLLSPLPVTVGDEDESLSDDLPPSTVFVHLQGVKERNVPYIAGLVKLTGVLEVGAKEEGGGRVSSVRLVLDPRTSKQILGAKPMLRASAK
jgi:hypothetical protein